MTLTSFLNIKYRCFLPKIEMEAFLIIRIILFIANPLRTLECLATPFTAVAAEKKKLVFFEVKDLKFTNFILQFKKQSQRK